ncbi:MAG: helix-turn-helix domain-containing protein [Sphingobacteriales bacterium]|nr:MAG: helix-turn-helix domain-containing protein [Sphingobacteriales bacterium]
MGELWPICVKSCTFRTLYLAMSQIAILNLKLFGNANENTFYVNTLHNHLITSNSHIDKPHKHDFFSCFFFTHGAGTHEIDFCTYDVRPGSLFFMSPGQIHSWTLSDDVDGYVFFHTLQYYDLQYLKSILREYPFFASPLSQRCFYAGAHDLQLLSCLLAELCDEGNNDRWNHVAYCQALITQVYTIGGRMSKGMASLKAPKPNHYIFQFAEFERLVEVHFREHKSPLYYAAIMHITPAHLNRICREMVDKTSSEIIGDRVVLEAKRLLMHSDEKFGNVGFELGYDDYAHFSKFFKKNSGQSPRDFVKQYVK